MTQQSRAKKNNIKITHIPLTLQVGSSLGIVNFPTQKYEMILEKPLISVKNHQQEITFKNAIGKVSDSEEQQEQYSRKKVIAYNRITIKPQNLKKRYFRVDIPVSKGPSVGAKINRERINFVIQFNQDKKGTLSVIDDVFDGQVEITNADSQYTMEERIRLQDAKLDARRKQEKVEIDDKKDGRRKEK